MILTSFSLVLMTSLMLSTLPDAMSSSAESDVAPLVDIPLKEEKLDPLLLENPQLEEQDQPQEGLRDIFDQEASDAFQSKGQKNDSIKYK